MNRIYRRVWNRQLNALVVASELATGDSGGSAARDPRAFLLMPTTLALALLCVLVSIGMAPDVSRLMMAETAAISLLGAIVGAALGSGVAQIIGQVVFGSGITMRPMVFVLVFVLLALTVLLASASSIRSILSLKPAEVLHGR